MDLVARVKEEERGVAARGCNNYNNDVSVANIKL